MIQRSNICKMVVLKKPNVVMVFSTKAPDVRKLSEDRWRIFKISKDLQNLVENGQRCVKSKENRCPASID